MMEPMLLHLRKLEQSCELIAYTYLPKIYVEKILDEIPELRKLFSYIVCRDLTEETEENIIKDLSPFIPSREPSDIIILDVE